MTILPDFQIHRRCAAGMVSPFDPALVNPASIDVRLGDTLLIESAVSPELVELSIADCTAGDPYMLRPGQFVLAHTLETFHIPSDLAAQFVLKSSRAREGLEHLLAGFCDPGWHGSVLTLELHNSRQLHGVPLWPGMKIGQVVFHTLLSHPKRDYSITGRYNGDGTVMASKGHR